MKPGNETHTNMLLFRTEASRAIGTGHLMRCMALAEICMEHGRQALFVMSECPEALATRLMEGGMMLALLDDAADADELLSLVKQWQPASIVIDGYQFDEAYRRSLHDIGLPVLAMDDGTVQHPLHADIVVNVSPLARESDYETIAADACLLLGPAYVALRNEFRLIKHISQAAPSEKQRVLITFGGSDPLGLTLPVADALLNTLPENILFDVVLGGAAATDAGIEQLHQDHTGRIRLHKNTTQMAELMRHATLAVAAAGSTLWELAYLAVPTIAVVVADNQAITLEQPLCDWFGAIDARTNHKSAVAKVAAASRALWHDSAARETHCTLLRQIKVGGKAATICATFDEIGKRAS